MSARVIAVVGATATGKSDLAVELALHLGGEVVNSDASQLYRGMDIGTAKLSPAARQGVRHHQIDVLDITQDASVAAYQAAARADVEDILGRGQLPVVCGGSGLYVRAALDVLEIPPTDAAVRAKWEEKLDREGVEAVFSELVKKDPVAAAKIDPRNGRRIVRALEVVEITGRPFSASMPRREYLLPTVQLGLRLPRPFLDERIERRTRKMWADGLLDEVADLERSGLSRTRTASRAVGYAQALAQIRGEFSEREAIEDTTRATRRLVRRQESWFGADPRIHWLDAGSDDLVGAAVETLEATR
ncbi:tRNA dimethylallyltransferase [Austwickia chelonae]|uniref:tRNA dimethylallyltransferase n=1 Tax=Austwickia chelonae NBRC 105200 TaxID=1184607 RepID=K6V554_9MICO|nr:tRNA (adenosine(37)-N6)-dimethylallyltransferase MiaA [Austwickia chelonae]GAB77338.1 tRNA dimethylallyltransferase [Austwickia chelonae NBRC 105200]SEW08128.1 tRNA dimethylallyltransferase [Austwickia chelonae]